MEYTTADLVDRYTILLLKQEHGQDHIAELAEIKNGGKPDGIDYSLLLQINRLMWNIEEKISSTTDIAMLGAYCLSLRHLNMLRIVAKNVIASGCEEPTEVKSY